MMVPLIYDLRKVKCQVCGRELILGISLSIQDPLLHVSVHCRECLLKVGIASKWSEEFPDIASRMEYLVYGTQSLEAKKDASDPKKDPRTSPKQAGPSST